jgi:hypothetical protein
MTVACPVRAIQHHSDAVHQATQTKHLGMGTVWVTVRETEHGYLIQSASTGSTLRTALRTASVTEM